ncbi:MAG: T9SS type A sorting domain-containing protein, partial [Bacteroidota bacterium]|nr:T9SS type A sorting domain-containing protein [Bacteroidota bacterium]
MGNVYNMSYQPQYIRYKLYADSGDSWQAGVVQDTVPVIATVVYIYRAIVTDSNYTTVKAIRFQYQNPGQSSPFTLGTDHLAAGLGLVKSEAEPSDVYVLTGAIINGVKYGTITSVIREPISPQTFDAIENYPNPFNNATRFRFTIASDGYVNITLYDMLGRSVKALVDERKLKGTYEFNFAADDMASGIYFAVLKTGSRIFTHKILL